MAEPPFFVQVASYVLAFHERNRCRRCGPDGWCPRVATARGRIMLWLQRRRG